MPNHSTAMLDRVQLLAGAMIARAVNDAITGDSVGMRVDALCWLYSEARLWLRWAGCEDPGAITRRAIERVIIGDPVVYRPTGTRRE